MPYIKRLVMHGFKSFPRKTELPFTNEINSIVGPNGSGKSNLSDALCFVLGRLSIKSMRASKSGNLIFLGTKEVAPAKEASVELVFDNTDRVFSIDSNEVSIERIVRKNGIGIYKINGETKTRQEILSLLAQAGMDPNGFNIILQGEIQNFVRMQSLERRKIIEEVSGISIYEIRKEKALKELEKTEEKLKEVQTILRERTSYLNNLEKQRQEALKYKKLEADIKKFKASIIASDLTLRKKDLEKIEGEITKKAAEIEKAKKTVAEIRERIAKFEAKINSINSMIQKSTGFEQDKLNQEIANLRAEIAGLNVKIENYENKVGELSRQKSEFEKLIRENEVSVKDLQKESPTLVRKQKDVEAKKKELDKLQEEVKKFYMLKSEFKSVKEKIDDKKLLLNNYTNESDFLLKQVNEIGVGIFDSRTDENKIGSLRKSLTEKTASLNDLNLKQLELEKVSYKNEHEINKQNQIKEKIAKIDICPVCKSKITEKHIHGINKEVGEEILVLQKQIKDAGKELNEIKEKKTVLEKQIEEVNSEIRKRESDLVKLTSINERKKQLLALNGKAENIKKELAELEKTRKKLELLVTEDSLVEQRYETARVELQEISIRSEENVNSEITFKQRELERTKISLKQILREEEDLKEDLNEQKMILKQKEELLDEKRDQEEELTRKFEKLIAERDEYQRKAEGDLKFWNTRMLKL
ncbi:AAA family ATPase [Candidatus Pacearchaeota archaeon]|nr:AAA family ATPase [Candidatus Pacearchaeota archaeon]